MTKVSPVFLVAACLICCDSVLAEEKSYAIEIPAQSLATALEKLAEQTKIKPFYNDKLVMGKTAPTIQGGFTPRDALQKLLSGSGLTFTFTSEDSVVINALDSGNNAPGTLPAVKVFGKALYDATAPDNPDYRLPNASTATKTDTPIMETPFNVQVVPRQVLEDRQSVRLDKALENISSVIPATGVGAAYGQQSGTLIRGFVTQDYYLDGVRIPTGRLTDGYREMANIQQVEVLKGPASILYGRMEPGGIVNLITKQALDTPFTQVSQQFGSYDFYRTTLDTTGPLSQNKDVLYRVNLAYENSGSFRDFLHNERVFFAPKLQWNISERSKLNMHLEYQRSANATDYGFLASQTTTKPLAFPISRNLAGPNTQS
jgi:iron complex outermembrane recepter protein